MRRSNMRAQRGEDRRQELVRTLRTGGGPILGSDLAQKFGVSRQVLVQDMAILRAAGTDIIATPRGYLLRSPGPAPHRDVLHVQHDRSAIMDELTILVDLGIRVLDIRVDHPVFGPLRGDLCISSRQDVREYIEELDKTGSAPLFELTGGRHSHAVDAPRPDLLEKAREELARRGYLRE
jgi:transcriptional regulator of NAD metabolism